MNKKNHKHTVLCWNRIGNFGDSTCRKLIDYVHCRNCPEYYKAAKNLFDREIPEGYLEECTALYAGKEEVETPGTNFVAIFRLKNEWLALKTVCLQEVTQVRQVHYVPFRTSNVFMGLVNIHGVLVPCISLADILGLTGDVVESSKHAIYKRLVVVKKDRELFVFPVDEMLGIRRISPEDQKRTPATLSKSTTALSAGVYGIDEKTVGLLDEKKLFKSLQRSLTF